ncbi:hypothetical protein H7J08_23075 [Mycobacterium frederiksbergense]|uniref:class A beta-lactamase-related serine hydrolase n=1 Tax=Mycolicibacterium frederiksbergense TaxID=117567 RepID=UPI0021F39BA1|nr:class A beta-lactamase-related serine hydrolase [Mycolicibacterium frederiksbergense]MCV7047520.1 hypothetical protein [Mycolicibacterium frederiksbergense]
MPPPPAASPPAIPLSPPVEPSLASSFDEFAATLGADVGLAFAPLDQPDQVTFVGSWSHGPAWSTIKVPLALAVLQENGAVVTSAIQSAITVSDNGAAQSMWEELGGGVTAASKVQNVLDTAGDPGTIVPSELRRAGFSIFGQTDWALTDQARFLARTVCDPAAAPVIDLMGQISSGQQWGLGTIGGTRFKGGWGPGTDGLYLVRQFGVVPTPTGQIAVAVAAVPNSGGFGDGTAVLGSISSWLRTHLPEVGGGNCASLPPTPSPGT